MTDWDREYRENAAVFGIDADALLQAHLDRIDRSLPALDVGCGQGRNSLFLARHGVVVHAVDPSREAVEQTRAAARAERLAIDAGRGRIGDVVRPEGGFGTILVFGLIPLLTRPELAELVASIGSLVAPDGLLFVTAFTTADPRFEQHRRGWRPVDRNSFAGPGGDIRTYLDPGELTRLFARWRPLHSWEGFGPEHRHGDGPVERHGLAEAVFRYGSNPEGSRVST